MGLLSGILGSAVAGAGSIYAGVQNAKTFKELQSNIKQRQAENEDWFDRRYNEDATQRADAQRLLTLTEESIKNRNKQAAGSSAVAGGTAEAVAAEKAANNKALSDVMGQIGAQAEVRKNGLERQREQTNQHLDSELRALAEKKMNGTADAVKGVTDAAGNLINAF